MAMELEAMFIDGDDEEITLLDIIEFELSEHEGEYDASSDDAQRE
jgi:hypothetical protein